MSKLHGPRFTWLMATGVLHPWSGTNELRPLGRSARTRAHNAKAKIDRLVLERARAICGEHDHGSWASCTWLCDIPAEKREEYRTALRADSEMTNEKAAELKRRFGG